jgi:death on curing protein
MIVYLKLEEVLKLHKEVIDRSGGSEGILNLGALQSAIAQPQMTFDGQDLYPELSDKAAALGFSLINNHCFVDGNKRIGKEAMEVFLVTNGFEIDAHVDEQEKIILAVASSEMKREPFTEWVRAHVVPLKGA